MQQKVRPLPTNQFSNLTALHLAQNRRGSPAEAVLLWHPKPIEPQPRLSPLPPQRQRQHHIGYRTGFREQLRDRIAYNDALQERFRSWRRSCPRQQPHTRGMRGNWTSEGSSVVKELRAAARRPSDGRVGHWARQWARRRLREIGQTHEPVTGSMGDRERHSRYRSAQRDGPPGRAHQRFRLRNGPRKSGSLQARGPLRRYGAHLHR